MHRKGEKKPQQIIWKEEEKKLHYPKLTFVATRSLSFRKINPDTSLSTKMLNSCERCRIPMTTHTNENIQRENYLRVNPTSTKKPRTLFFHNLSQCWKKNWTVTLTKPFLLDGKFILPTTLNIGVKIIELNLYLKLEMWSSVLDVWLQWCCSAFLNMFWIYNDPHKSVCQESNATTLAQSTTNRRDFNTRWQYAFAKYFSEMPVDIEK